MRKIICDRCGRDAGNGAGLSSEGKVYDLCEDCDKEYNILWEERRAEEDLEVKEWLEGK